MRKKVLAILLAVVMAVSLLPTAAFAVDAAGACGENVTWSLDNGVLTISGTGAMANFDDSKYPSPWSNFGGVHTIIISDGVTSIGDYAFYPCGSRLTNVTIPNSVTTIGVEAFFECSGLTSVVIPESVTSIGDMAFQGCTNLTSVTIPSSVTYIGGWAFEDCTSLTSVTIPDSVTSIGKGMFSNCVNLTSVTIPSGVTSIGLFAFDMCDSLTDINFGGSESQWSEIDIDNAMDGNSSLLNATIHYNSGEPTTPSQPENPGADDGYTSFAVDADITPFYYTLDLGGGGGAALMFTAAFDAVKTVPATVSIEDSWGTETQEATLVLVKSGSNVTIEIDPEWAGFFGGSGIITVMSEYSYSGDNRFVSPSSYRNGFALTGESTTMTAEQFFAGGVKDERTEYFDLVPFDAVPYYDNDTTYIIMSENLYNGTPTDPISGTCGENVTWTLNDGVLTISGAGPMDYEDIYGIGMPWSEYDFHTAIIEEGVTSICRDAFRWCTSLTSVTIPDSVTFIGDEVFFACSGLTNVIIPDGVTSIGYGTFNGCSSLTSITIPVSVTSIGYYAFDACTGLTDVYYCGSESQWAEIFIGDDNAPLRNAAFHYNRFAFSDVPADKWYVPYVQFSIANGIIKGYDDGTFNPEGHLSRAQTFTILARLAGASDVVDNVEGVSPWYKNAVNWVIENGISDGSRPEEDITREEFADMLYKLSKEKTGADASILDTYPDRASLSAEAVEAMTWAVDTGIIKGNADDGRLNPKGTATRAEAVTMLQRYFEAIGA